MLKLPAMSFVPKFVLYYLSVSMARYFLIAGIAFFLAYRVYKYALVKNKIQQKSARRADFIREIKHSMISNAIMVCITLPFFVPPLNAYTHQYSEVGKYGLFYLVLSVPLALIVHDTYFYWMHRLLHHPAIFKHTHLLHHKSTNPSPWAAYAFSAVEAAIEGMILPLLLFILPMHPTSIFLFITIAFMINVYGHLGYEIAPKGFRNSFLFQILNTSVHHNLHHSKFKGNYGLYFRVWDRIMGTESPNYVDLYDRIQAQRFGAPDVGNAASGPSTEDIFCEHKTELWADNSISENRVLNIEERL